MKVEKLRIDGEKLATDSSVWAEDAAAVAAAQSQRCVTGEQGLYNCDVIRASLTCWPNDLLSSSSSDLT